MSLEKPQRIPGEFNSQWTERINDYRLNVIEQQIEQLQKTVKGLKK